MTRLTETQRRLAARFTPLASKIARTINHQRLPEEDAEAIAMVGLTESASRFDSSRGKSFGTFAGYRIAGAVRDAIRKARPMGYRVGNDAGPTTCSISDGVDQAAPENHLVDDLDAFEARLTDLPPVEAALCRAIYRDGLSQSDFAKAQGLSKSRVNRIHNRALARLRHREEANRACLAS